MQSTLSYAYPAYKFRILGREYLDDSPSFVRWSPSPWREDRRSERYAGIDGKFSTMLARARPAIYFSNVERTKTNATFRTRYCFDAVIDVLNL